MAFTPAQSGDTEGGTQGVRRIADVLRLLASRQDQGLRFVQIADLCGLARPTAHRLLKALSAEGLVERRADTRRYQLGPLVFELGIAAAPQFNLAQSCAPSLQRLADRTGDTAFLFIRRGVDAICVTRIQGHYPIQTPMVTVGSRQPLGVNAGGLALLFGLGEADARDIVRAIAPRLGAYGELDEDELLTSLDASRKQGYASIGEKAVPGVTAIGLPIRDRYGNPVAALTVAAISRRMTVARQREIVPWLQEEVERVEQTLYR